MSQSQLNNDIAQQYGACAAPESPRSQTGSRRGSVSPTRQSRGQSAGRKTRGDSRSPSSARRGGATKVRVYEAMGREAGASLEQVWTNAYWVFKYVPKHPIGTRAPPAQIFAVHVEPGLFRFFDKLDEVGVEPQALVTQTHAAKFTAANLRAYGINDKALDAINYFTYKAFGTKMAVNNLYGDATAVKFVSVAGAADRFGVNWGKVRGPLGSILRDYVQNPHIPLRDAAFIFSALSNVPRGKTALAHYNDTLTALRQPQYDAGRREYPVQHVALSQALHAWLSGDRENQDDPSAWPLDRFASTRSQADSFFASLSWQAVKHSTTAAVANANQLAMLRYEKAHRQDQDM